MHTNACTNALVLPYRPVRCIPYIGRDREDQSSTPSRCRCTWDPRHCAGRTSGKPVEASQSTICGTPAITHYAPYTAHCRRLNSTPPDCNRVNNKRRTLLCVCRSLSLSLSLSLSASLSVSCLVLSISRYCTDGAAVWRCAAARLRSWPADGRYGAARYGAVWDASAGLRDAAAGFHAATWCVYTRVCTCACVCLCVRVVRRIV